MFDEQCSGTNLEIHAQVVDGDVALVVVIERAESVCEPVVLLTRERNLRALLLQAEAHLVSQEAHRVVEVRLQHTVMSVTVRLS